MFNPSPVVWREAKISLTSIGRIVNYTMNPMLALVFFAVAFTVHAGNVSFQGTLVRFTDFLVPGLLTFQVFILFTMTFSKVRIDNANNILITVVLSKTSSFSYYVGLLSVGVIETFLRFFVLMMMAHFLVSSALPPSAIGVLIIIVHIIVGSVIWFSVGFLCGIFITREEIRDVVFSLLVMPIAFCSSTYYSLDAAPEVMRTIAKVNPLTWLCDAIREAFLVEQPLVWLDRFPHLLVLSILLFALSVRILRDKAR